MEQSKTKTKILTEQGIFQPTPEIGAAMQAYADQEKRKEAIAVLKFANDKGIETTFGKYQWVDFATSPASHYTHEQLYDLYLHQTQNKLNGTV